jgi:hypothetical protein
MTPTHKQLCAMEHEHTNQNGYGKSGDAQGLLGSCCCVGNQHFASSPITLPALYDFQGG